ncbi:MAG: phosphotransferase family protein [Candidatus Binatia bacterium]|nr:phosphotransferase family protein [Candidatus Binatia bacterium]
MTGERIADGLAPLLATACGVSKVTVDDIRTMTGGAAREAWRLDVSLDGGSAAAEKRTFVALLFRAGGQGVFSGAQEAVLLQAAGAAGVPVARVVCAGEEELGRPFYVMEYVAGETIGRRLVRDDRFASVRGGLPAQMAEALAAIHRVPVEGGTLGFLPRPPADKPVALAAIRNLEAIYRGVSMDPHPAFELAFRWLLGRVPETTDTALVHGDFRVGNLMVDETVGLRAVLDWELAHVGDPIQDLGWACVRSWRFGQDDLTCGGVGRREDLVAAYEGASGRTVDPEALRFWEVFGNLNWGVITLMQVRPFLDKSYPSIELAGIGRRAAETEWELLNLIEGKAH